jgi:hypothetical protein
MAEWLLGGAVMWGLILGGAFFLGYVPDWRRARKDRRIARDEYLQSLEKRIKELELSDLEERVSDLELGWEDE